MEKPGKWRLDFSNGSPSENIDSIKTMLEPEKKDNWFHTMRDRIIEMEMQNGRTPTRRELWKSLCRDSPEFDDVSFNARKKELQEPGEKPLSWEAFTKRYERYYPGQ